MVLLLVLLTIKDFIKEKKAKKNYATREEMAELVKEWEKEYRMIYEN